MPDEAANQDTTAIASPPPTDIQGRGPGRPTKLSDATIERLCEVIRLGAFYETAYAYAGITRATFHNWLKKARELDAQRSKAIEEGRSFPLRKLNPKQRLLLRFLDAVGQAIAEAEVADLTNITVAAEADWHASAWRLERRFPERWAPRHKIEGETTVKGDPNSPVQHQHEVGMRVSVVTSREMDTQAAAKMLGFEPGEVVDVQIDRGFPEGDDPDTIPALPAAEAPPPSPARPPSPPPEPAQADEDDPGVSV